MTERQLTWGLRLSAISGGILLMNMAGWRALPGALLVGLAAYLNGVRSERYDASWAARERFVVGVAIAFACVILVAILATDAMAWGGARRVGW